ncbi:MAG: dTDP-4-dehydrorhamnose 3,5-epimerase family protein, partial [Rhodospirillales bacterium]|nr:dTDP-4-dehydrorhamnose 3,5-epimerase family protein [Rhodospirillales bacterium]
MDVVTTTLDGVLIATPPTIFTDHRGTYVETYNQSLYAAAGIDQNFIQDDISVSRRHVLRGIHGDYKTWKLVSCIEGALLLAVVNFHAGSGQYMRWET